ncbi:hypothetical protein [Rhodoferax sp.]|uniref:hypothetical protein n=1 Tax=Rhodoferax sp. TaxID=50421 RepID=UPI00260AF0C3|nr:hypothetical protein [Rhodoferax sp.]
MAPTSFCLASKTLTHSASLCLLMVWNAFGSSWQRSYTPLPPVFVYGLPLVENGQRKRPEQFEPLNIGAV